MEKTIRNEIMKAGRLEEVVQFISKIYLINDYDLPVTFNIHRRKIERLATENIVKGATLYLSVIYTPEEKLDLSEAELDSLNCLQVYVNSELEMWLHNYATMCAHRKEPDESELEHIRVLYIIDNSLSYLTMELYKDEMFSEFDVPEGWKKKEI